MPRKTKAELELSWLRLEKEIKGLEQAKAQLEGELRKSEATLEKEIAHWKRVYKHETDDLLYRIETFEQCLTQRDEQIEAQQSEITKLTTQLDIAQNELNFQRHGLELLREWERGILTAKDILGR